MFPTCSKIIYKVLSHTIVLVTLLDFCQKNKHIIVKSKLKSQINFSALIIKELFMVEGVENSGKPTEK